MLHQLTPALRMAPIIVVALISSACHHHATEPNRPAPIPVCIQVVQGTISTASHSYGGELEEGLKVSVMAQSVGSVSRVLVHNNERVVAGQLLVQLDDTRQRSALATAKATLSQAEDGYERVRRMFDGGGVAEVKLVEVQTKLSQAQAALALAENELNLCSVRATQGGTITGLDLQEGQSVVPGLTLMQIIGAAGMAARFSVPESDVAHLHLGDPGQVQMASTPDQTFSGRITEINLVADPLSRSYSVRLALDKSMSTMLPGMVCRVQVGTDRVEGVLLPAECVHLLADGCAVWVVEEGKARRRRVEQISYHRNGIMVGQGLNNGDSVITNGFQKMYNGADVAIIPLL